MKIKSNLVFNTALSANHQYKGKGDDKVVIGGALPKRLVIPAGSTIELPDDEWVKFDTATSKTMLEKGHLVMVEAPKLSEEEQAAADATKLAQAQADVAKLSKPKGK